MMTPRHSHTLHDESGDVGDSGPSGIGLVLGAGGATGAAFHVGTLLALQHDLGWEADSADAIVGSSAGSIVGGLIRAGLTADDLAAWGASVAPRPAGRRSRALLDELETTRKKLRPARPRLPVPPRAMLGRLKHPTKVQLHTALLAMLPSGWIDAGTQLERIGELVDEWPRRPLWIPAVRLDDARRVVWGCDDHDVTLGQAIAASCAVPGVFAPVKINGGRYVDGGAHSATNADLMLEAGVHSVIVLSPMSGQPTGRYVRPDHVLRVATGRQLRSECSALSKAGITTHVFEPDAATLATMGVNAFDRKRTPRVVRDAFFAAGQRVAHSAELRHLLDRRVTANRSTPVAP